MGKQTRSHRWMDQGTALFLEAVSLNETALSANTRLPGWTRKHLVAHVAANADALANLVRWARTGIETPMYASAQARDAGIQAGARLPAGRLCAWAHQSANQLTEGLGNLTAEQWNHHVVTAQGRSITVALVPWLRAREVMVHAVDLGTGLGFTDLPTDFLVALCEERRWTVPATNATTLRGPVASIAAYLTGREHPFPSAPALPAWL
jgi:maleylpyruvate isomerase